MSYNADGQMATTTVVGNTYTGLYAADGSWNIVTNVSASYVGRFHPCGALNAVVVADTSSPNFNPNGSINVVAKGGSNVLVYPRGNNAP